MAEDLGVSGCFVKPVSQAEFAETAKPIAAIWSLPRPDATDSIQCPEGAAPKRTV